MGQNLTAYLVHGVVLRTDFWDADHPTFGAYPSWYDEDEDGDIAYAAEEHLLRAIGGLTTIEGDDGYYAQRREARKRVGLELVDTSYGDDGLVWILATQVHRASDGAAIELPDLTPPPDAEERTSRALAALEQDHEPARWLFGASWG